MDKPKYQKLKDYITDTIVSGNLKPGGRVFSENMLSIKFAISRHTVRHAISELINEGWLYSEQGKGTFVRDGFNNGQPPSKTVAVITTYLNDYIFPSIIHGIDNILTSNGYNIMLTCTYNRHEKERACLENLLDQNVAALIVEPTKSALPNPNLEIYKRLRESGKPVIFIHGCYSQLDSPQVVEDDEYAGYVAARHLIIQGHTKIGGIFKIDDIQGHLRFSGYQRALLEKGIELSDGRVLWFDTEESEEKLKPGASRHLEAMISECTAIVCYNDQVAVRLLDIIRELGLSVPGYISLVSFDDSQLAIASEVKLTTVAHPKEKLGESAGQLVLDYIGRKKEACIIKMKPELIIRNSSSPVNC